MVGIIVIAGIALTVLSQAPHSGRCGVLRVLRQRLRQQHGLRGQPGIAGPRASNNMRGQALTLMNLVLGTILIGALLAGTLADSIGARWGLLDHGRLPAGLRAARPLDAARSLVAVEAADVRRRIPREDWLRALGKRPLTAAVVQRSFRRPRQWPLLQASTRRQPSLDCDRDLCRQA